jgi:hypothetical protein
MSNLAYELKNSAGISGEVDNSDETLKKYSRDASIFDVRPEVVVFPKNTEEVSKLVKWVKEKKQTDKSVSITARSAGTDMSGGPLNESIIADFTKYFNTVSEVKPEEGEVVFGRLRDFVLRQAAQGFEARARLLRQTGRTADSPPCCTRCPWAQARGSPAALEHAQ